MISIFFSACSILAGATCKDVEVPLVEDASLMTCQMFGQIDLAIWSNEHPNWHVTGGYKCGHTGQYANL